MRRFTSIVLAMAMTICSGIVGYADDKKAEQQEELTTKPKKRSRKSKGSFIETRLCAGKESIQQEKTSAADKRKESRRT